MKDNEERVMDAVKQGAMTVREITAAIGISRITLYKYLAVLEARGMIKSEYIGSTKLYSVAGSKGENIPEPRRVIE